MQIIVIGAGASGMLSAILLAEQGHRVTVLEKKDRPGKKLMATGNGRCNFTNRHITKDNYHGENPEFAESIIDRFSSDFVIEFFKSRGLEPLELEKGKIYPMSLQSKSVLDVLCREMRRQGVMTRYKRKVERIEPQQHGFLVHAKEIYYADKIVLAAGGAVMKSTGSDGDGYRLAESLGHSVTDIFPGIVQLCLKEKTKEVSGVKFPGEVFIDGGQLPNRDFGDVLFTDYGISGPPILQLSATLLRRLKKRKQAILYVDLVPFWGKNERHWRQRCQALEEFSLRDGLIDLIHENLLDFFFRENALPEEKKMGELTEEERNRIWQAMTAWPFHVTGPLGLNQGQVTCGGIATTDVDEKTLESKICPGLYLSGEVLDIDGDCGGYNLHWAWATAFALAEGIGVNDERSV